MGIAGAIKWHIRVFSILIKFSWPTQLDPRPMTETKKILHDPRRLIAGNYGTAVAS